MISSYKTIDFSYPGDNIHACPSTSGKVCHKVWDKDLNIILYSCEESL